jgi:hypothetical protein
VEKYHQPIAYLSSIEVFDELLESADRHAQLLRELPLALRLLATAIKVGVSSDAAIGALLRGHDEADVLNLVDLAELADSALEDRDMAVLAAARMEQPDDGDMSLGDFAAELGLDIAQVRADVAAGTPRAKYDW